MSTIDWIEGHPPFDDGSETIGDRHVWLRIEWHANPPAAVVGYLYSRPASGCGNQHIRIPWVRVPESGTDRELSDVWGLTHYAELPEPSTEVTW